MIRRLERIMQLEDIVASIGDWIPDCAVLVQARSHDARGPLVLWCNSAFCELTGERADQLIGQPLRLPPPAAEDGPPEADVRRAIAHGQLIRQVLRDTAPSGQARWLDLMLRAIPDESGAPLYWLATLRDITRVKMRESQAEAEIQRLQGRNISPPSESAANASLAWAAHAAWDGMAITDTEGKITWTNAAFTQISGYAMAEALGARPGKLLAGPNSDPGVLAAIAAAISERQHVRVEIEYQKKDGSPFWAEVEINPQFSPDGQFCGFVGILKDITERVERAAQLKAALHQAGTSLDLLHSVTAEAAAVLFQFVLRGHQNLQLSFISPEAERTFGLPPNTFAEHPGQFWELIQPQDLHELEQAFIAGESIQSAIEREVCLSRPSQACRWFTLRARPRRMANGETQWTGSLVDSTKEHEQRAELNTLLELHSSVLDASPFAIMSFEALRNEDGLVEDFELVQVNRITATKLGREIDSLVGQSMSEIFDGVQETQAFVQYRRVMESGEMARFEIFYREYGMQDWLQIHAAKRGDNGLTLLIQTITDVKESRSKIEAALAAARRSAEEEFQARSALLASERHLRAALEVADVWVWDVNFQTGQIEGDFSKTIAVSGQSCLLDGLHEIHEEDRERVTAAWNQFAGGDLPEFKEEFRIRFPDNGFFWVRSRGAVSEWDEAKRPKRAIGALVDIDADRARTERLRAVLRDSDLALMEAEALSRRLDLATNASGIGVWEVDLNSGRLTWTQAMYAIYGREADGADLTYHDWVNALHPDDRTSCEAFFLEQQSNPGRFSLDFRILRQGEVRHVRCLAQVYQDRFGRSTVIGVNWDVTEQILAQQHLEQRRREAEAASVAKSQFLANMSHEIRTPMNGVLGMAGALASTGLTPAQAEMVTIIQGAGESLMTVLNDILDFSKIEAGHMEMEKTAFALADLAGKIRSLHALKAKERGIAFEVICTEAASQQRLGDPHRLTQILHNLVSNAIKFTAKGFVRVRLEAIEGESVLLEVADSGIGLSPEQQASIFQHFTQADASTTRQFGGTGLGLAIVRGLSQAMGGEVLVESALGQGAIFRVLIPLELVTSQAAPEMEQPLPLSDAPDHQLNILAAEDNATNRFVLRTLLAPLNASLTFAVNGLEAVEMWRSMPFDVVLMDISMPIMDGQEALKIIRSEAAQANSPDIPILAVTANAFDHQAAHYRALGFNDVVPKPIEPMRLINAIHAVIWPPESEEPERGPAKSPAPDHKEEGGWGLKTA